jgi:hypothetical protein
LFVDNGPLEVRERHAGLLSPIIDHLMPER